MSFYNQSVVAEPGDDSSFYDGGDGYSGGSGDCDGVSPCRGGSNGGDGDDGSNTESAGGHGTHENVGDYKLDSWVLTPGAGGDGTLPCSDASYRGAGGGGVLVDGVGPNHYVQDGEGYGGGGGYCGNNGQQGVILIEVLNMLK